MITYLLTSVREYLSSVFFIYFFYLFFPFRRHLQSKIVESTDISSFTFFIVVLLLFVFHCSSFIVRLSLFFFYCSSSIVLLLLFVSHCSSFIVRLSLLFMFIKISKSQIFDIFRSNVEKIKKKKIFY